MAKLIRLEGNHAVSPEKHSHKDEKFDMEEGLVEMAFHETGVHLIGTGPLSMTLLGNNRIFLDQGEIKLVVPPQGIGFVVDTLSEVRRPRDQFRGPGGPQRFEGVGSRRRDRRGQPQ